MSIRSLFSCIFLCFKLLYKFFANVRILKVDLLHCKKKTGVLKMTPVGVNRGPQPQVLKLHPRVEHNTKEC